MGDRICKWKLGNPTPSLCCEVYLTVAEADSFHLNVSLGATDVRGEGLSLAFVEKGKDLEAGIQDT